MIWTREVRIVSRCFVTRKLNARTPLEHRYLTEQVFKKPVIVTDYQPVSKRFTWEWTTVVRKIVKLYVKPCGGVRDLEPHSDHTLEMISICFSFHSVHLKQQQHRRVRHRKRCGRRRMGFARLRQMFVRRSNDGIATVRCKFCNEHDRDTRPLKAIWLRDHAVPFMVRSEISGFWKDRPSSNHQGLHGIEKWSKISALGSITPWRTWENTCIFVPDSNLIAAVIVYESVCSLRHTSSFRIEDILWHSHRSSRRRTVVPKMMLLRVHDVVKAGETTRRPESTRVCPLTKWRCESGLHERFLQETLNTTTVYTDSSMWNVSRAPCLMCKFGPHSVPRTRTRLTCTVSDNRTRDQRSRLEATCVLAEDYLNLVFSWILV